MPESKPHIAILGAGPTGLEAALAATEYGFPFTLYEASDDVAGYVRGWGHVRLFTPWSLNVSDRMRKALEDSNRRVPSTDEVCPTGAELVEELYQPLGRLLGDKVRCGVRVRGVGRLGLLKHEEIGTAERASRPFRLLLEDADGRQWTDSADIVFDCTGNPEPNRLGDGGIPAPGEQQAGGAVWSEIPDLTRDADDWAGRTTLLVGAGHSAQTALIGLVELAESHPDTRIEWVLRSDISAPASDDPLPERARLMGRAAELAADPPLCLRVRRGVVVDEIQVDGPAAQRGHMGITLRGLGGTLDLFEVDRILSLTGRVGDHQLYRQLQVHECYATSGPMKLAAALLSASGGGGDCLAQTSLGPETLKNPEPGFFILGSKSYGRRTDFLMRVGWQQVGEVFQLLEQG